MACAAATPELIGRLPGATMKLESLACNHCGAALNVPDGANFVTCNHCNTTLAVRRDPSVTYTEKIEKLHRQTERIADDVAQLRYESELARIDREWEEERRKYLVTDKHGGTHEPSAVRGIIAGLIAAGFGGFFALTSSSGGAPAIFPIFGVLFIVIGLVVAATSVTGSAAYQAAYERYRQRRAQARKPD